MSNIEEIEGSKLDNVIKNNERGVLVDFWSPWCAPCRTLRPHLNRIAGEREANWKFVAVNGEADTVTAARFEVRTFPTLIYFKQGQEAFRIAGLVSLSAIVDKLDDLEQPDV